MENQTKLYPSYMGEFYAANPVKFEKRKNNVKPMLYYGLAVVAVIIVIFPGFIPVAGWLVRTVGVIAVLNGRSNCCINMSACSVFEQFRLL